MSWINLSQKVFAAMVVIGTFLGIGTVSYHFLEGWTYIESFYFSVVTLSTVGYGNLTPTTPLSMLFTSFYILVGVATVVAALTVIGTEIMNNREAKIISILEKRKQKHEKKKGQEE